MKMSRTPVLHKRSRQANIPSLNRCSNGQSLELFVLFCLLSGVFLMGSFKSSHFFPTNKSVASNWNPIRLDQINWGLFRSFERASVFFAKPADLG